MTKINPAIITFLLIISNFLFPSEIMGIQLNFLNRDYQNYMDELKDDESENEDILLFGDDEYESFYDFSQRKSLEQKIKNEHIFDQAVKSCEYAPINTNSNQLNCSNFKITNLERVLATSIFLFTDSTIGLISSADMSVSFYRLGNDLSMHLGETEYFENQTPYDACADKAENVYVLFPDQSEIALFNLKDGYFRKVRSAIDYEFMPTSISCTNNSIYVGEPGQKEIRVYDQDLNRIITMDLSSVIVSPHNALAGDKNIQVLADGLDGVALIYPNRNDDSMIKTCHIYKNIACVEDVDVYTQTENRFKSSIYITDSCDQDLKEYSYSKNERLKLTKRFQINWGSPVSMVKNSLDQLIVLTNYPSKIGVLNLNHCR